MPEDAVNILLERRQKERLDSLDKAKQFCQRYKNKTSLTNQEDVHYVLLPPKHGFIKKSKELYEATEATIEVFTLTDRYRAAMEIFLDDYKKALKRRVKVRYLIGKAEDQHEPVNEFLNSPFFDFKVLTMPITTTPFIIFDRKELLMVTTDKEKVYQSQTLWTNNPLILESLFQYFELLWEKSSSPCLLHVKTANSTIRHKVS